MTPSSLGFTLLCLRSKKNSSSSPFFPIRSKPIQVTRNASRPLHPPRDPPGALNRKRETQNCPRSPPDLFSSRERDHVGDCKKTQPRGLFPSFLPLFPSFLPLSRSVLLPPPPRPPPLPLKPRAGAPSPPCFSPPSPPLPPPSSLSLLPRPRPPSAASAVRASSPRAATRARPR